MGKLVDEYGRIISIDFETQFRKLVPKVRRAKKRLKHEQKDTLNWYKENNRLNRLISEASYLQFEEPIK